LTSYSKGTIEERAKASAGSFLAVAYTICSWLAVWNLFELPKSLLILVLVCAWCSDTGACFFGRTFGKKKLLPILSPNKTWEGAIGGFICGVCAVFFFQAWLAHLQTGESPIWLPCSELQPHKRAIFLSLCSNEMLE